LIRFVFTASLKVYQRSEKLFTIKNEISGTCWSDSWFHSFWAF